MTEHLAGEVALVVDTNLFLECRALSDLPWHELGYASVELIVSRPVQQELDNHKKNERGRTFKKALAATKLLRGLVTSGQTTLVIRESEPRVTLSIMQASRIQPDLNDALDPSFNDDAIILRMLQYQRDNDAANVRLITHDTGPMATAVSLRIPFIPIPDTWLMREQDDAATKEANKLKSELQRLRSQEPQLDIKVLDENGNEISRLDTQVGSFEPLTFHEVSASKLPNLRPPSPRDPDSFYWRGGRPSIAKSMIELTCENWRHGVDDEHFLFRVTASDAANLSGVIQCEIHAENLSDPVSKTLPVRIERIPKSTLEHAKMLIGKLLLA